MLALYPSITTTGSRTLAGSGLWLVLLAGGALLYTRPSENRSPRSKAPARRARRTGPSPPRPDGMLLGVVAIAIVFLMVVKPGA